MEIPTFHPTEEEFEDFEGFIEKAQKAATPLVGLIRVVPPASWLERVERSRKDVSSVTISCPIRQILARGKKDPQSFVVRNMIECSSMAFAEFEALSAQREKAATYLQGADRTSFEEMSRLFWEHLLQGDPAVYGADSRGSLFDESLEQWNLNNLPSILDVLGVDIAGVTHSYLYVGMWRSLFAAHTEDMELYSINFLHEGSPKMWYAVPPSSSHLFEETAASMFPSKVRECSEYLRHKVYMLSPSLLKERGVPFCCGSQKKGEFMVTFPRAYHWGFNSGLNVAEAVNFALEEWIPHGKMAKYCTCRKDSVKIDMEHFLYYYVFHLRETGVLKPIPPNPAWKFKCTCGMEMCSEDPEMLWPCKPQFQCDKCDTWVHIECHGGIPKPAWCAECQRDSAITSPQKKKRLVLRVDGTTEN